MFDDLANDSGFSVDSVEKSSQQSQQQHQSSGYQQHSQEGSGYSSGHGGYQQQRQNNNGGYQQRQSGGFQRKPDEVSPPYLPVVMFVEKTMPPEVKQKFFHLASKLIGKGYTVRLNPDDIDFVKQVQALSTKNVELYLPWRNFNEFDSKHTFNTLTSKDVAQRNFQGWEKIPDSVKAILAAQVRMVFGDRNNSIALMVITYSGDGASRIAELTKDTGRVSFIIKMACTYGFSVVNMGKQSSEGLLQKYFDL